MRRTTTLLTILTLAAVSAHAAPPAYDGWTIGAPRDELLPAFSIDPTGGRDGRAALVIRADSREGLDGYWTRTFPVEGGQWYQFRAFRKTAGVDAPVQSAFVQIQWTDDKGNLVARDDQDKMRPDFPMDHGTDDSGWTQVSDTYFVPQGVSRATIELRLRWPTPGGQVKWSGVSFAQTAEPTGRIVRLAAVHHRPKGGASPMDNCMQFAPLIEQAAQQKADLIVLPECLTYYGLKTSFADVAEPVPGPSTEYFAKLAKKYDTYIVVPVVERDEHLLFNTAALVGPDGSYIGKYRKVCLPREEWTAGIVAGTEYPVFDTRFGKVGIMICWDIHFPEVARNLANNGAEVIAVPIWGGNPNLCKARAIENQVFVVTSTYNDREDWMKSGVWDHEGNLVVEGKDWGSVVVQEVNLDQRTQWWFLGDFKSRILREKPPTP